ncbi:MAG: hypothetical protein K9L82_03355 [Chromatiaceae bacterium]|nr:hypothetical protein [Chromatiaceae bacterium]MCF7993341.1 hypothetical protein [Chromatiaceae bacterium]MCF8014855.1 hypothetical protein [Chromatiaceae bacterium]
MLEPPLAKPLKQARPSLIDHGIVVEVTPGEVAAMTFFCWVSRHIASRQVVSVSLVLEDGPGP